MECIYARAREQCDARRRPALEADAHEVAAQAALENHAEVGAAYGNLYVPWAAFQAAVSASSARLGAMAIRPVVGLYVFGLGPRTMAAGALLDNGVLRNGPALRLLAGLAVRSEPAAAWEVEGYDAVAEDAVRAARSRDALACALTAMRLLSNARVPRRCARKQST